MELSKALHRVSSLSVGQPLPLPGRITGTATKQTFVPEWYCKGSPQNQLYYTLLQDPRLLIKCAQLRQVQQHSCPRTIASWPHDS